MARHAQPGQRYAWLHWLRLLLLLLGPVVAWLIVQDVPLLGALVLAPVVMGVCAGVISLIALVIAAFVAAASNERERMAALAPEQREVEKARKRARRRAYAEAGVAAENERVRRQNAQIAMTRSFERALDNHHRNHHH